MLLIVVSSLNTVSAQTPDTTNLLPTEAQAKTWITQHAQVRLAIRQQAVQGAAANRLRAGPHETLLRLGGTQRRDETRHYAEQEVALERAIRWGNKRQLDDSLGTQTEKVAQLSVADARHEAGRMLLQGWFEALVLREKVSIVQQQAAVLQEQQRATAKRVKAGDAAKSEQVLADAALASIEQTLADTQQRLSLQLAQLQAQFPTLTLSDSVIAKRPIPTMVSDSQTAWTDRLLNANHELLLARAEAERASTNAQRVRADRMPDPSVGVRFSNERAGAEKVAGLYVAIPFSGAARSAASQQATAESLLYADQAQLLETRLRIEASALWQQAQQSIESWQRAQRSQANLQTYAGMLTKGYQMGEGTLNEVLLARKQALDAALIEVETWGRAWHQLYRLRLDAHEFWDFDED
jgi:outer membrane protein TolC